MAYIFDTAVNGRAAFAGKVYFFKDDKYVRYDWGQDMADSGPSPIGLWNVPAPFLTGVDAAVNGAMQYQGKVYFFRGNQYVGYDWATGAVTGPSPLTAWNLPPAFASGIDSALTGQGSYAGKAYFFKGNQYITYDWATGAISGPAPLSQWNLTGAFLKGVHSSVNGEGPYTGSAYFFRGPHYARYYWSNGAVGGPSHLSLWKLRGGVGS
ncbi:hemopexin repeat-containing protein [Streptomyces sp. NPDC005408]|uniref:hemopexin repeat-containing protein n=1 Tax=Streptomyces sp. NPDC005408 TaxID=3155341 RepID=UPI00339DD28E